jgi:nucleoside-diphosphate-sugar epimerase
MKRALITGCGGFVGRHFAKRLLDDGWWVTGVDDLSAGLPPHQWMFRANYEVNLSFVEADVRRWFVAQGSSEGYDLIIHCAAVVGGRQKIEDDPLAVAQNFAIDADFFRWVSRAPQKGQKVVYFSSSAVYPTMFQRRETHCSLCESLVTFGGDRLGVPDETYGWAKLAGEYLARRAVECGVDVVIYRPFSGYGEDQDLAYPFPSIVRRAVAGEAPLVVWGSGDQVRDFVHIDDVVGCVMATVWQLKPGEALNIGSGDPTTFKELASKVMAEMNYVPPDRWPKSFTYIVGDKAKPEGVFWRVADPAKMRQFYHPKVSLAKGVRRAVERQRLDTKVLV